MLHWILVQVFCLWGHYTYMVNPHCVQRAINHSNKQNVSNEVWKIKKCRRILKIIIPTWLFALWPVVKWKDQYQLNLCYLDVTWRVWPHRHNEYEGIQIKNIFKATNKHISPQISSLYVWICVVWKLNRIWVAQFPSTTPQGISAPMMSDVLSAVKISISFHFTSVTFWAFVERSVTENIEGNGVDGSVMDHEQDFNSQHHE